MISLHQRTRQKQSPRHSGFTLIELLVAITIMLIIFSMTAGVVALAINTDRIPSSARTVQAAILGARDRALRAGKDDPNEQPKRGLRFVLNPKIPNTINSLIYVGSQDYWTDGTISVSPGNAGFIGTNTNWTTLTSASISLAGSRIQILDSGSTWYRLRDATQFTRQYVGTANSYRYRLELPAAILPNEQPLPFDSNVVINLNFSEVPTGWDREMLFTPEGNVSGPLSASKPIYLYLCTVDDALNGRGPSDPKRGEALVIKFSPQTGAVQTFPVNPTGDPFKFAKQ